MGVLLSIGIKGRSILRLKDRWKAWDIRVYNKMARKKQENTPI
jgi:hypothetical protein